jgi:YVTN family beta-propeller protein
MEANPVLEPRLATAVRRPSSARVARLGLSGLFASLAIALGGDFAAGEAPIKQPARGTLYTADEQGSSISAIDLSTGQVRTIPVRIAPHNVQFNRRTLLAVGTGHGDHHSKGHRGTSHATTESKGRLLVLDTTLPPRLVAEIEVGRHPAHVVGDRDGRRAFVTNAGDDTVSVVDVERKRVIKTIATGRYPHGLRSSPDGREVYVANVQDGSLSVLNTGSLAEVARIPVGRTPVQVGFTPDGGRLYVSLRDENRVAVIDTVSRTVIGRIDVGRQPIQVHATPNGRFVYVANQGTDAQPDDTVSVIDVAKGAIVDTIRTGNGAHGVAVSDDGAFVFVTNIADSTISVIETATRKVIRTYPVGKGPNGITYRGA